MNPGDANFRSQPSPQIAVRECFTLRKCPGIRSWAEPKAGMTISYAGTHPVGREKPDAIGLSRPGCGHPLPRPLVLRRHIYMSEDICNSSGLDNMFDTGRSFPRPAMHTPSATPIPERKPVPRRAFQVCIDSRAEAYLLTG